jgi:hypothetical protein
MDLPLLLLKRKKSTITMKTDHTRNNIETTKISKERNLMERRIKKKKKMLKQKKKTRKKM